MILTRWLCPLQPGGVLFRYIGEHPDTGGKHLSALTMINSLQHEPKPTFVTSCFNFNPFLRLFKVWPACPDLGWRQRGHIAVNSALPLHSSRWYPAKAAGLFRQAPMPAESLILRFKPRVHFLFFYWLWDKLPVFPISNSIPWYWESAPAQAAVCFLSLGMYSMLLLWQC